MSIKKIWARFVYYVMKYDIHIFMTLMLCVIIFGFILRLVNIG